ncbi:methyltransferase [Streptomyces sp. NBC_01275]|uniref:methyltransferase n=1 Tax=Streptomyces sp. NBC_01275 TaxID=2903807 RepID=UPI002251BE21|nr:methyltransferase [Streptomyces sp. NBC_01275]MCX4762875.1 methyltransferase [Streptomyces sp. NBC_01275]
MAHQSDRGDLLAMADLLTPATIRAAATLRIADHLGAGVGAVEKLAELTGARPDLLELLLRHLTAKGVLTRDDDGTYAVTELGDQLRESHPASLRGHLAMDGLYGRADLALVNILHTVRTGEPAHATVFGRGYWESVNEDPAFVAALEQSDSEPQFGWGAELIFDGYDWSRVGRVVDVGGHSGAVLMELLRRQPALHGTLVDLRNVAEVAGRRFAAAGLADRAEAVVGSFFEPLPTGGDVYLLSAILADWSDEQATTILRRCAEAAGPRGKVLLAEVNLQVPREAPESAALELWLRATMPAPVRTVEQLRALGAAAGLQVTWEGPHTAVRSILEFSPC